jgi:hypothetical protein
MFERLIVFCLQLFTPITVLSMAICERREGEQHFAAVAAAAPARGGLRASVVGRVPTPTLAKEGAGLRGSGGDDGDGEWRAREWPSCRSTASRGHGRHGRLRRPQPLPAKIVLPIHASCGYLDTSMANTTEVGG